MAPAPQGLRVRSDVVWALARYVNEHHVRAASDAAIAKRRGWSCLIAKVLRLWDTLHPRTSPLIRQTHAARARDVRVRQLVPATVRGGRAQGNAVARPQCAPGPPPPPG